MPGSPSKPFFRISQKSLRPFKRLWYEFISTQDTEANMRLMNYGWASLDLQAEKLMLNPEDENDRYCIQLYHHLAGEVDLEGKDILEIGSGRGGGASFIARYLNPKSMTGLELANNAVKFCNDHYDVPNLKFVHGDAESPQFDDNSFDVIINVESSHCYKSMSAFLNSVSRLLRPGGFFLFTDFRDIETLETMRQRLQSMGLSIIKEEDINANILKAIDLDNDRKEAMIRAKVPRYLQNLYREFAATKGTRTAYADFCNRDKVYKSYILQKA
ncbi:MAG: class I SAM-dependent methyltransferase [Anaerolineaceae bacterium]|nr:class I SAM-dependent methyltransferase [Anaerolineaceae bacterium]